MTLPADYFGSLYQASPDPWGFEDRWYEERKRAVTLAALPEPRYLSAFEPGCSIGMLTLSLAQRCDSLLASDLSPVALREAADRLRGWNNVYLEQQCLPRDWPPGKFDLVVLSEILYYLSPTDLDDMIAKASCSIMGGGTLLSVHWRRDVPDYPQKGDAVQRRVEALRDKSLEQTVHHVEADFDLAVYVKRRDTNIYEELSVAAQEGLR